MKQIQQFLAAHNLTAKTVTSAWLFLCGLYAVSPAFKDYIVGAYNAFPHGMHQFIGCVLIPGLIFFRSQHKSTS